MRVLDGFNGGWIDFAGAPVNTFKGASTLTKSSVRWLSMGREPGEIPVRRSPLVELFRRRRPRKCAQRSFNRHAMTALQNVIPVAPRTGIGRLRDSSKLYNKLFRKRL
jgi:hypothetical protein